ncbi:hypothetical protein LCGC14_2364570 [marine sediment metagenome]|uniref:Uncharacterized protein n=2 Tax=marine sediment metagenome TaxID=412755 RepID=A0A0F9F0C3_9ZZZZ
MANCGRCFRPKPDLKPYRETVTDEICKSCTYDLEAVVGFLEYHGWTILPPGEIVEIAKSIEERVIRDGMQSELTPPPPTDNGPHQTLTEAALEGQDNPDSTPGPEKQRKGRQKP